MGTLDGQVAVITGGGRGVGRSISLALAAEGASVVIDDIFRDQAGLGAAQATVAEIEVAGGRAIAAEEDITTSAGAKSMVDRALAAFGRVDILVCSAGNTTRGLLQDLTEEQWDSLIRLHLKGHFLSCKMVLPHMIAQNSGRIVTVSSRGAFFQVPESKRHNKDPRRPPSTAYAAAKAGILGLTTTLAVELWDTGVTVNSLLPSATTQLFPETGPRMLGGVPASTSLDPDDIAPLAVFLCSPDAADISGKIVYASGGDVIIYPNQLSMDGTRMVRKQGRWTQDELREVVPSLLGIPSGLG